MMKNIEKQKQEIKKDNLENNANDLEKRVEKIEKETIHILNRIQLFLFLYWIINIIISIIC